MNTEISYKDLKISMLSDKALALLSEFALIWREKTGELIDVDSDDAVIRVFQNAKRSTNRRLRIICMHIRAEFTNVIQNCVTHCDQMLAVQIMSHISKGHICRFQGRQFIA
jgi:hypothetical protein